MSLQKEIDLQRKQIKADGYPTSIGELANMYAEGDLDIHPAFQRFFRWDVVQKSRWIESLLLGIPTPSLFVAQRKDGIWDVVDGLQRLSTIFEFMGVLRDKAGNKLPPLALKGTKYLPSLENKMWDVGSDTLSEDQRRFLKREKLDIKIVLRESDESSKYELFQRLNTGGSTLSDQELRNCMLVGIDESFFEWIEELSRFPAYAATTALPDTMMSERFDIELVLRFLVLRNMPLSRFANLRSVGDFLTEEMLKMVKDSKFDREHEAKVFRSVFSLINAALEDDAFRKYDQSDSRFKGPVLISAFEVLAIGLAADASDRRRFESKPKSLREFVIKKVWDPSKNVVTRSGESAVARMPRTLKLGRELFGKSK